MRFHPNSLFFRFSATLVLSLLAFQITTLALVGWLLLRPLVEASAADLAELVELSVTRWQDAPPHARAALARELAAKHSIEVGVAAPDTAAPHAWLPLMRHLETRLSQVYAQPVRIVDDDHGYRLRLQRHGEIIGVRLPGARIGTQPLLALVMLLLASFVASLLLAYRLAHRLTQPLRDAAQAARRVGRRELPQLAIPRGAEELVELAASFNRMAHDVDLLVNNRTLLLAGVSHDLRSPLARLRLAIELARDTRDWSLLDAMERHVGTLTLLLDDYLEFAQSAGAPSQHRIALHKEAAALVSFAGPRLQLHGTPIWVEVNRVGLVRILRNVVENALRYAGETSPVELRWQVRGRTVEIIVRDHGPGLSRPAHELLQPFARGDNSRNSRTGGTGLGLAICNMIAQAQNWPFEIADHPDGGVRVCLVVPLARDITAAAPPEPHPPHNPP